MLIENWKNIPTAAMLQKKTNADVLTVMVPWLQCSVHGVSIPSIPQFLRPIIKYTTQYQTLGQCDVRLTG